MNFHFKIDCVHLHSKKNILFRHELEFISCSLSLLFGIFIFLSVEDILWLLVNHLITGKCTISLHTHFGLKSFGKSAGFRNKSSDLTTMIFLPIYLRANFTTNLIEINVVIH